MFSLDAALIDGLTLPEADKAALRELFGQCARALNHKGPVTLEATRPEGATDAELTVSNYEIPPRSRWTPSLPTKANGGNGFGVIFANGPVLAKVPIFGAIRWAKANANWVNVAGDASYVTAYVATDYAGTLAVPSESITLYLPRYGTGLDPAAYNNGVVPYFLDENGRATCPLMPNSLLGEIRMWNASTGFPTGWQAADGTNGTYDLRDRFPGGYSSAGTFSTLGAAVGASITFSGSGTTASGTASITVSSTDLGSHSHSHSLTLPSHVHEVGGYTNASESSHTHTVTVTGNDPGPVTGGTEDVTYPGAGYWTTSAGSSHTHTISGDSGTPTTSPSISGSITSTALGSHTHTATDAGHTHTFTMSGISASALNPATRVVQFIQRVT